MKRRVFTILSALSLMLCVATCALWVRSYYQVDEIYFFGGYSLSGYRGRVGMTQWYQLPLPAQSLHYDTGTAGEDWFHYLAERNGRRAIGFVRFRDSSSFLYVSAPHGLVAALFAIAPALWGYKAMRKRRISHFARSGRCAICGYDLRATPDKCPECGTIPKKS